MDLLNRTAMVIKPKQPFADWVNSLPTHPSLPETNDDPQDLEVVRSCYLFPTTIDIGSENMYLNQFKIRLLKEELNFWEVGQEQWPSELSSELFDYFFDIEILPMVIDLEPGMIHREPFITGW